MLRRFDFNIKEFQLWAAHGLELDVSFVAHVLEIFRTELNKATFR